MIGLGKIKMIQLLHHLEIISVKLEDVSLGIEKETVCHVGRGKIISVIFKAKITLTMDV